MAAAVATAVVEAVIEPAQAARSRAQRLGECVGNCDGDALASPAVQPPVSMPSTRQLVTFEARCAACDGLFALPGLGDFAYGELLLCSADGQQHALVDGFSAVPAQVVALLDDAAAKHLALWPVLAALADPPPGSAWSAQPHCPHCGSASLAFQHGERRGSVEVPMARFADDTVAQLATRVAAIVAGLRPPSAV